MDHEIEVQQLWPGNHAPGDWKTLAAVSTWDEADKYGFGRWVGRGKAGPRVGFGDFRHPDGGPKYGTVRAVKGDEVRYWDALLGQFVSSDDEDAIAQAMRTHA